MPTYAVAPSAIVCEPTVVQLVPFEEIDAVTVDPVRASRTHWGGVIVELTVLRLLPPTLGRRWKPAPLPADTNAKPCAALALSELLIMTPALDHACAKVTASMRAVMTASPTSG